MLDGLHDIPWHELEHAYGTADDVPELIEDLLSHDPKVREKTMWTLYGNVFHQGTRYPASAYVVPFLIELCSDADTYGRPQLLDFWKSLICGYFNIQERPYYGDGEHIWFGDDVQNFDGSEDYAQALHDVYRESLKGVDLLLQLLQGDDFNIRTQAVAVLACLPTMAERTVPALQVRLRVEDSMWVRATIAFALGELGDTETLNKLLGREHNEQQQEHMAPLCMAACELARIEPSEELLEPLLMFVSREIEGYDSLPGAGGASTGDAAFSLTYLPREMQQQAVPLICDRLEESRSFATMPLVTALLSAAFDEVDEERTEFTPLQRHVLLRMLNTQELWSIGNLYFTFKEYGVPHDREKVAELLGVKVADDKALSELSMAVTFSQMGFLEEARERIESALKHDPAVFARMPRPDECWLFTARAFAETDQDRALQAYDNAAVVDPDIRRKVAPTWELADVLDARDEE